MLNGIDAAIIATPVNIFYLENRVINGYVYINADGQKLVFVRRPLGIAQADYHYIRKVEQIPDILQELGLPVPKSLALETNEFSYNECERIAKAFATEKPGNITKALRQLRSVKSEYELEQFRIGARLQSEALSEVKSIFRPGMTDADLCIECERIFRKKGCLGLFRTFGSGMESFMGSLLAGDNAGAPSPYDFALGGAGMHPSLPLGHNGTVLTEGMAVMIDLNGNFNGYIADQSRCFSVGRLSDEAYRAHETSLEIHAAVAAEAKEGTECEHLYQISLQIATKNGFKDNFMGLAQHAGFVGHGIGLQINELPVLCPKNKACLQAGNVIALEPKFVIKGVGAVGVEDSYIVHQNGLEKITSANDSIIDLLA